MNGRSGVDQQADRPHGVEWSAGPDAPRLGADDVHLWRVSLDVDAMVDVSHRERLAALLDDDEREAAARFLRPGLAERFTVARAVRRLLLARYVGVAPQALRFARSTNGKPVLDMPGTMPLHFNASRSGDTALLAVSRTRALGVDVEAYRNIPDADDVVTRYFSPLEVAEYRALPAGLRERAFIVCWTRKEAYMKAIGDGLGMPLDAFDVTVDPREAPRLSRRAAGDGVAEWTMYDAAPDATCAGTVVVEGAGASVQRFRWEA